MSSTINLNNCVPGQVLFSEKTGAFLVYLGLSRKAKRGILPPVCRHVVGYISFPDLPVTSQFSCFGTRSDNGLTFASPLPKDPDVSLITPGFVSDEDLEAWLKSAAESHII